MAPSQGIRESSDPLVLLSCDVSATRRAAASRVAHLIFGRKDTPDAVPPPYIRRPGFVWVGQSVFLLPQAQAIELAEKLHALGATVAMAHVSIPQTEIEVLRRRRAGHRAS